MLHIECNINLEFALSAGWDGMESKCVALDTVVFNF